MAYEQVKDCLKDKFKRSLTSDIVPAMDLKDGAIVSHEHGYFKAFTTKHSGDEVVIVLSQLNDGTLMYHGEYKQSDTGEWVIY